MCTERSAVYERELVDAPASPSQQADVGVEQRRPLRAPQQLVAEVVDARVGQDDARGRPRRRPRGSGRAPAGARHGAARTSIDRSSAAVAADARLEADREALELRRPADLLDVGARRRARATPSARCRWCAGTRSSAARAASPACRAAWSRSCGSSSAQHGHRLRPAVGRARAVMSAENGVWPPSCVATSWPLTQTRAA